MPQLQPTDSNSTGSNAESVRITNRTSPTDQPEAAAAPRSADARAGTSDEKINEFQKFVLRETGNLLPIFGSNFFATSRSFVPSQGVPVAGDYRLGPGDELLIRAWGSVDVDFRAVVDVNGAITIPKVGAVSLVGVRAADVESVVSTAFAKVFRGFTLNVTLGKLRGITIYVVGQAHQPGTYMVSSLSTVVTALFESGGPNANGSLRRVQVKRAGQLVAEIDLYGFLAHGDKSADIRLMDGDVIVIPPASGYVALTGKVERPAIYELKGQDDSIGRLLDVAGGVPVVADPRRAFIERIDPTRKHPRSVDEFALDSAGLGKSLKSGDLISIIPITAEFSNAVTLRGGMRIPFRDGMKITDLIPSKEFLLSRTVVRRKNAALLDGSGAALLDQIGNRYDEINWDYAVIERIQRSDFSEILVPFNLGKALAEPDGTDNLLLQPGDTISVFAANDLRIPIAKRKVFVRLEGEVKRPGVYQVSSGENLINLIQKAGGLTPDAFLFGSEFERESVRQIQQKNLDAFIRRIEQQGASSTTKILSNLSESQQAGLQARLAYDAENRQRLVQRLQTLKSSGRIALNLSAQDTNLANLPALTLENGDRLIIPSHPSTIHVVGSVGVESALLWQPGRSISDYLILAGVGADADMDAMMVLRANGTALSNSSSGWMSSVAGKLALPGDVIVIPEKSDKETFWSAFMRQAKDFTQVFSNLGLGAAAIKTLR